MSATSLFIASHQPYAGSLIVSMGMMELLRSRFGRVAFFRPVVESTDDKDIRFMREHFRLDQSSESCYGFLVEEVEEMLSRGALNLLTEELIARFRQLEAEFDFVLLEGLSREHFSKAIEFNFNTYIAKNLRCPYLSVINGKNRSYADLSHDITIECATVEGESLEHFALFINRLDAQTLERFKSSGPSPVPLFAMAEIPELDKPTLAEVQRALGCELLLGDPSGTERIIHQSKIAAMNIEHLLERLCEGDLIITPGDRLDVILATLSAHHSKAFPSLSGILLTGGLRPSESFVTLVSDQTLFNIPVMTTQGDTYQTITAVNALSATMRSADERKIALAMGNFMNSIDRVQIESRLSSALSRITTPAMFEYGLLERARGDKKRIVLPESSDERILRASEILLRRGAVEVILLGDPGEINHKAAVLGLDLSGAQMIKPCKSPLLEGYIERFYELRKAKGLTIDAARDAMAHFTYFATMMVYMGDADGMVSGAIHTTQDTIRPALQIIKTTPDISLVSSLFFICLETQVLVYADCAVNQDPSAEELAQIAIASAKSAASFGIEPRIAMLSYSTGSSGKGDDVEKVRSATQIVREKRPDLLIEGPIQYDAAIDAEVAKTKLPDSPVAGRATVFIFPDLNTGNNTYKAVQRSSGAIAIGPVLQGLRKPVNDLSRGCLVADIVNTVLITAIQAQGE
ncbi:MAG: phosphate acetyltransferase [Campylobacterales bacterium]|nr:phosphate acetyltransferase [Campylobacterales bacterium]